MPILWHYLHDITIIKFSITFIQGHINIPHFAIVLKIVSQIKLLKMKDTKLYIIVML